MSIAALVASLMMSAPCAPLARRAQALGVVCREHTARGSYPENWRRYCAPATRQWVEWRLCVEGLP